MNLGTSDFMKGPMQIREKKPGPTDICNACTRGDMREKIRELRLALSGPDSLKWDRN